MRELRPGLWHWQTPHAAWSRANRGTRTSRPTRFVEDERLLLFDPLGVPSEVEALAADLPVEHVLATHGGPFDRATLERALAPS